MSRDITLLHPELQELIPRFLAECQRQGLNVLIAETWRTKVEQDSLYAQGRSKPGKIVTNCQYPESPHCWGVAFDFCRNERGKEYDNSDKFFNRVGAIGKTMGLFWGGDFKSFVDMPHFEMAKFMPGNSVATLKRTYGTPENFKKTWGDEVVDEIKIELNGVVKTVRRIKKDNENYIRLRDLADSKITIDYRADKDLPIVRSSKI